MSTWTARSHELLTAQAQAYAEVVRELDPAAIEVTERRYYASNGGDHRALRGIPAIGRNVAGAIPGTSPHAIR